MRTTTTNDKDYKPFQSSLLSPSVSLPIINENVASDTNGSYIRKERDIFVGFFMSPEVCDKCNTQKIQKDNTLYKDVIHDVNILKSFKNNWDGYGASKFSEKTISTTCSFLKALFNNLSIGNYISDIEIEPEINDVVSLQIQFSNPILSELHISLGYEKISSFGKYEFSDDYGMFSNFNRDDNDLFLSKLNGVLHGIINKLYIKNTFDI